MDFKYGQRLKVDYNRGSEYIYLNLGYVLKETEKSIIMIFPDGKIEIPKDKLKM